MCNEHAKIYWSYFNRPRDHHPDLVRVLLHPAEKGSRRRAGTYFSGPEKRRQLAAVHRRHPIGGGHCRIRYRPGQELANKPEFLTFTAYRHETPSSCSLLVPPFRQLRRAAGFRTVWGFAVDLPCNRQNILLPCPVRQPRTGG